MIHTLDLSFLGSKHTIAAYLIKTEAGPILFETGPHSTFSILKQELAKHDVKVSDIKHVFVTHIHFDHAGAAWALAKEGAKIYVHPFGARHLQNPEKLYNSAKRIYQDKMDYLWGKMEDIAPTLIHETQHEEEIRIGELTIKALHTPGHAVHHIAWQLGDDIITGDVAGVQINDGMVVPPCPPPDINIEDWMDSIAILRAAKPNALYLTHFGKITAVSEHLDKLEHILNDWAAWMKPHFEANTDQATITPLFQTYVAEQLKVAGVTTAEELEKYEKANPSWMSVAGLMRYWKKKLT